MRLGLLLAASVIFIILGTAKFKLHPFLVLLLTAFGFGVCSGMPLAELVKSVNGGFGDTVGKIGIVIIAGTIIGVFLEKSGGAFAIAGKILKLTGEKNVPLAMSFIGYIVSIPVFCDSGFVILTPLAKALCKKSGITLASCAIALSLGLYATHTMVPPTPGPIFAAEMLKADLGLVIMYGAIVAFIAMMAGWLFAMTCASRVWIDPAPELSEEELRRRAADAPGAAISMIPILMPLALIVLNSIAAYPSNPFGQGGTKSFLLFIGSPVVALLIGVFIAFALPKKKEPSMFSTTGWVGEALTSAAIIIAITGAGGSFGEVLKNSGIKDAVGEPLMKMNLGIWLPFLLAAAIKTAQGSSTVAIITTATILKPLAVSLGFVTPPQVALAVVTIGAGSMFVSHANDSYFWVVTQFSKMDALTGYKLHSIGSIIESLTAGAAAWAIFTFFL
ncbi:MAG: GntP family permease [Candidatus Omnitrophota bacterium]